MRLEAMLKLKNRFGSDVEFTNMARAIAGFFQHNRQTYNIIISAEMVVSMHMPVVAIGMIVKSAENDRPTCTATGCCAKRPVEPGTYFSKSIEIRRFNDWVSIDAYGVLAVVVGYEEDDIRPIGDLLFPILLFKCWCIA